MDLGGVNGYDGEDPTLGTRLRRILQVVVDVAGGPLAGLRILDLGSLEGMVSLELARRGATVVGIEGRRANIAKAEFAKKILGLTTVEFVQDDVRSLRTERFGTFDLVLCLGILYHLPVPDVFTFGERVFEVSRRAAVMDTHVAMPDRERDRLGPLVSHAYRGLLLWGREYRECDPQQVEGLVGAPWAALGNATSFWFTRPSLLNLLDCVGFTSVHECQNPRWLSMPEDRLMLIAYRGERITHVAASLENPVPDEAWPEESSKTPPIGRSCETG